MQAQLCMPSQPTRQQQTCATKCCLLSKLPHLCLHTLLRHCCSMDKAWIPNFIEDKLKDMLTFQVGGWVVSRQGLPEVCH